MVNFSTSIYDKRDDFKFPHHKLSVVWVVIFHHRQPMANSLWLSTAYMRGWTARRLAPRPECFILRARRLSSKLLKQGYFAERLEIVIQEVLLSIRGSYSADMKWSLSRIVNRHSDPWPTVTSQPIWLSTNFMTLIPSLTSTGLWVVVTWSICNGCGMICRVRLPYPDTWFRPPL